MKYKWRPNAAQRKEFAARMANPEEKAAYEASKEAKATKRRATSRYDYRTAGGYYVPTKAQYDYCMDNMDSIVAKGYREAANMVVWGFTCNEKVFHDYIHVVNGLIRGEF